MSDMGHHGGHQGHMHAGQGGDGASFSHSVGVMPGHHQHGFLAHLLGLDHDAHGHHHGHSFHQGVPQDPTPQGSPSWSSPLQALKVSDVFQGINVTPNVMFLILFAGFAAWLVVIYWVRHHEPLANQVLGSGGGYSTTAQADRRLVAGMRYAVPIRTSRSTGAVYVPNSGLDSQPIGAGAPEPGNASLPVASPALPPAASYPAGAVPAANMAAMSSAPQAGEPAVPASPQALAGSPMSSYVVPIQTPDGLRVKTITNR